MSNNHQLHFYANPVFSVPAPLYISPFLSLHKINKINQPNPSYCKPYTVVSIYFHKTPWIFVMLYVVKKTKT